MRRRRRRRWLLTGLSVLSLLVCLSAGAMWVRNLWASDHLLYRTVDDRGRRTGEVSVWSWWGSLIIEVGRLDVPVENAGRPPGAGAVGYFRSPADPTSPPFDRVQTRLVAGFGWGTYRYSFAPVLAPAPGPTHLFSGTSRVVLIPWYAIVLVAAVLPIARLRAARRQRHRTREGLCLRCGYDLRATPGRCPECGAEPGGPHEAGLN
jgi:hypothetical protein